MITHKMAENKNPISILEELAAIRVIEKPQYSIPVITSSGVVCEVKCGDISVSVLAHNKKIGKIQCASKALSQLQIKELGALKPLEINNNSDQIPFNAIGKLNETCSMNGVPYPDYIDHGWKDGNFVMECKYISVSSIGMAINKKLAKQLAAIEILKKLPSLNSRKPILPFVDKSVEAIEMYQQIRKDMNVQKESNDHIPNKSSTMKIESTPYQKSLVWTEEELCEKLTSLGIKYIVIKMQHKPLVLVLKATGKLKEYTFIKSRNDYSECIIHLLHSAFEGIHILNS